MTDSRTTWVRSRLGELDLRRKELDAERHQIEAERQHLIALLQFYERPVIIIGAGASFGGAGTVSATGEVRPPASAEQAGEGPTDRIKTVVRQTPGLVYSEVIERAKQGVISAAEDPTGSVAATLQSLIRRGVVVRRDGRHYIGVQS